MSIWNKLFTLGRAGAHEAMCLQTVPDNVRQLFAAMRPHTPEERGIVFNFDRNDIAAEVRLHVVRVNAPLVPVRATGRPLRLVTPLRPTDAAGRVAHMQVHSTHRSFQRYFHTLVHTAGPDAALLVAIHHPLLNVPLRSPLLNVRSLQGVLVEVEDDIATLYTETSDGLTRLVVEVHVEHLIDVIVHGVLQSIVEGQ